MQFPTTIATIFARALRARTPNYPLGNVRMKATSRGSSSAPVYTLLPVLTNKLRGIVVLCTTRSAPEPPPVH